MPIIQSSKSICFSDYEYIDGDVLSLKTPTEYSPQLESSIDPTDFEEKNILIEFNLPNEFDSLQKRFCHLRGIVSKVNSALEPLNNGFEYLMITDFAVWIDHPESFWTEYVRTEEIV